VFSATSLGFYAQAERFAKLPSANITNILQRVTYPVLCTIQDDDEKLRSNYRKLLRLSGLIVFPLMCLLAGLAYPLVDVLLGKKWEYTAALLIPICFNMMFYPIAAINLNLLQVKGRSDLFLKLEIIKKIIGVVVLVCSIPFGLLFMCYSTVLSGVIMLYVNTYYTKKIIGVDFWMQLKDLSIILLFSFLVFIECMFVSNNIGNSWLQLVIGLFLALVICCVAIKYCKIPEMSHIKSYIS
jgi:O-antigen/teichoic acid export membrane protein